MHPRMLRNFLRTEAAQSLAEFALLTPILFVMLIGAVDIGRYTHFRMLLGNSAHAGAEYGSLNVSTVMDNTGITSAATNDAPTISGINITPGYGCVCADGTGTTSVCTTTMCSSSHRLLYVTVVAKATFKPLFNYPFIGTAVPVTQTATQQVPQ
jgi:Flp pilus assembly protein TadG